MQKVDLQKVLDLLVSENHEAASKMLHEWFVGKSKAILEELMQEDDAALDIEDAKEEIEAEEFYADVDLDEAGEEGGDDEIIDGDIEGDVDAELAVDDEEAAIDDLGAELDSHEAEDAVIADKVDDLEAQLADLKAEFDKILGVETDEVDAETDLGGFDADVDAEADVVDDSVFESKEDEESEEDEELDENVELSDDDYANLEESFELESVKEPAMAGNTEIGDGGKITVGTKSPLPNHKPEDRVGGTPVEIKGKTHKGYDREAAPAVESKGLLKNQVRNAKQDLKSVPEGGDKAALLNKGPAPDKGKSPIGGGATDLRGSDFKRKK